MAGRSLGVLTLDLVAKTGGFTAGMNAAERHAAKTAREIEKRNKQIAASFKSFGIGVAVAGAAALTAALSSVVKNTVEAQQEQAQLGAVLKSTGQAAGFTQKTLNDMANTMSKGLGIDGGEITKAQTALLAFTNIVGDKFPQALQAAADMSARMGMSMTQASELVGRALDVPSQGMAALSKQGFRFTDSQKDVIKSLEAAGKVAEAQDIILKSLQDTYGGAAEAARNTFAGAIGAVKNALKDVLTGDEATFGGATSALNDLADAMNDPDFKSGVANMTSGLAEIAAFAIRSATEIAKMWSGFVGFTDWLAGEVNKDSIGQLTIKIEELNKERERMLNNRIVTEGQNQALEAVTAELRKYQDLLRAIEQKLEADANAQKAAEENAKATQAAAQAEAALKEQREAAKKAADEYAKRQADINAILTQYQDQIDRLQLTESQIAENKLRALGADEKQIEMLRQKIALIGELTAVQENQRLAQAEIEKDSFGLGEGSSKIDALMQEFATEAELENMAYQDKLARFQEYADLSAMDAEERRAMEEKLEQEHQDRMAAIESNAAAFKVKNLQGILATISTMMNSHSKKMFNVGKAAAIANAAISTYEGAIGAYKAMAGIPIVGPALGIAAAAAVTAAGISNIASIRSTSFGGGGSPAAATPTQSINAANTPVMPERNVYLHGIDPSKLYSGSSILELLNGELMNGGRLMGVGA